MIPKTINRLKKGFYPYHTTHLANKSIYRMKDINAIERIIKMNRNDAKYYLVTGQKGCGKTTLVESVITRLKEHHGIIYIKAEQTPNLKTFNQDLARAFNFNSFERRLTEGSILANLWSGVTGAQADPLDEFVNILNHIELACKTYQLEENYIKPTMIIDHSSYLAENNPQALKTLQSKAKYWADHNIMTVIFVGNDGTLPTLLSHESDSSRMEYVHVNGMNYGETVDFIMEEFSTIKAKDEAIKEEEKKRIEDATKELTNFYRWNLASKTQDASTPISEKDMLKKVFEYVVINYIGGNFMDAMRFVEECLNGLSMKEIEETFLRRAYDGLLEADLLFEPPYTPEKLTILTNMKKIYLSPMRAMEFKEFRKGISEAKIKEYLGADVFFYNRVKGTVRFTSPYYRKYIDKEIVALNEALRHKDPQEKPKIIYNF